MENPKRFTLLPSGVVHSVSFSPDGNTLVSSGGSGSEGEVRLWDVATETHTRIPMQEGGLRQSTAITGWKKPSPTMEAMRH